ncbi:MAG: glycosyltransferase family 4 protein [Syntrophorhabdaceae bacterium]|nr:glycosyltransferase family 4 protein [Syntrophorhabdaceae bacterium]
MRIIYPVSEGFDPRKARFHQILQTSHALAKKGCEIDLILGRNEFNLAADVLPYYSLEPNPNLHLNTVCMLRREGKQKIHVSWNGIFHIACLLKIRKMLREKQIHALYTRHPNIADFFIKHRRSLKMPIIFEAHEIFHLTTERKDKIQKMKAQEARIYSKVDGIVSITQGLKNQLEQIFTISTQISVIPSGVNIDFYEGTGKEKKAGKILYVGQLYPWKGVGTLLEAMCYVTAGELHVVGGEKKQIDDLIMKSKNLGIANRIFFHGQVSPQEVKNFIKDASVAVHPLAQKDTAYAEFSSPLKIFEYMAARIPIVASDLPGIREVLTDKVSVLLVPPDNPKALAKGIQSILDNPTLGKQLAEKAYKEVRQHSWAKRAERIEQFIGNIRLGDTCQKRKDY